MDTLVLNANGTPLSMLPLSVITWQTSIRLVMLDKVKVLREYDDWVVRSPSVIMPVPSIVMATTFVKFNRAVKYSRSNIYLRDDYTCQLCGDRPRISDLTLDHVLPKSLGGGTGWENIVTACKLCNERKGNDKAVIPKRPPRRPSYFELIAKRQKMPISIRDEGWLMYLQWPEDLVYLNKPKRIN